MENKCTNNLCIYYNKIQTGTHRIDYSFKSIYLLFVRIIVGDLNVFISFERRVKRHFKWYYYAYWNNFQFSIKRWEMKIEI